MSPRIPTHLDPPPNHKMGRPRKDPWTTTRKTNKPIQAHANTHARLLHISRHTGIPMSDLLDQACGWLEREYSDLV